MCVCVCFLDQSLYLFTRPRVALLTLSLFLARDKVAKANELSGHLIREFDSIAKTIVY